MCLYAGAICLFESHTSQPSAPFPLASDILFVQVKDSTDVLVRMYFFSETPQSSSIHSLLPFPEFYLMDKDSSLRDIGGEETKGSKRSPCFKEDRRCVIGVEGKFPFFLLLHHLSFLLVSLAGLWCHSCMQGWFKGQSGHSFSEDRKAVDTGKGVWWWSREGWWKKEEEVKRCGGRWVKRRKAVCGTKRSTIDVNHVGMKAWWSIGRSKVKRLKKFTSFSSFCRFSDWGCCHSRVFSQLQVCSLKGCTCASLYTCTREYRNVNVWEAEQDICTLWPYNMQYIHPQLKLSIVVCHSGKVCKCCCTLQWPSLLFLCDSCVIPPW